MPTTRKCSRCVAVLPVTAYYCRRCGMKMLPTPATMPAPQRASNRNLAVVSVLLASGVIIALSMVCLWTASSGQGIRIGYPQSQTTIVYQPIAPGPVNGSIPHIQTPHSALIQPPQIFPNIAGQQVAAMQKRMIAMQERMRAHQAMMMMPPMFPSPIQPDSQHWSIATTTPATTQPVNR